MSSPPDAEMLMEGSRQDVHANVTEAEARRLQLDASNCPFGQHVLGCDWQTSLLLKCAFLAMCNWYTLDMCCQRVDQWANGFHLMSHAGYCASPKCAGIEWFYNIALEWSEQGTGRVKNIGEVLGGGSPFPRNRFAVETVLRNQDYNCKALLDHMQDEKYGLLPGQLSYQYAPHSLTRTTSSTTTLTTTTTSTTSTTSTTTSTTQTVTTTTSTTSTLPVGRAAVVKGSIVMRVISAMTFVTDPKARRAIEEGLAEIAQIPEIWIQVKLRRVVSRWLAAAMYSVDEKARRLIKIVVSADYTIVVPANNPEGRTGMGCLEAIMTAPIGNVTGILRTKVTAAIGMDPGLKVVERTQPTLGVVDFADVAYMFTTTTIKRVINATRAVVTGAPPRPFLHVIVVAAATLCWMYVATSGGS